MRPVMVSKQTETLNQQTKLMTKTTLTHEKIEIHRSADESLDPTQKAQQQHTHRTKRCTNKSTNNCNLPRHNIRPPRTLHFHSHSHSHSPSLPVLSVHAGREAGAANQTRRQQIGLTHKQRAAEKRR